MRRINFKLIYYIIGFLFLISAILETIFGNSMNSMNSMIIGIVGILCIIFAEIYGISRENKLIRQAMLDGTFQEGRLKSKYGRTY